MGKKKSGSSGSLGKALIRDRFGPAKNHRNPESMLHTTEINDGYDWGRLNLQSVTEEDSFQEFLSTAELAGTEFQAEKLNIKFVNPKSGSGLLSKEQRDRMSASQKENKIFLRIPRRPKWNESMSAVELQTKEKEDFLEWRRQMALLQEEKGLVLTPYEKNLEFWRQLWRVVERSDVLVQIVDARNPLLFRCEDLEKYTKEIDPEKTNVILINKADFLTEAQRETWAQYFQGLGIQVVFFSAITEEPEDEEDEDEDDEDKDDEKDKEDKVSEKGVNSSKLLSRDELVTFFRNFRKGKTYTEGITTIGLVGYPNVGKSSTINALLMHKKVSVSATPGKTKHFQTLFLDKDLLLCDCPGLVMPSFISTKAEMILNGILPIDQMRDHVPPITLLGTLIPKYVLEDTYGIMISSPMDGEDPDRPPTAEEILNAYGYNRGFMTQNGQPDNPRSSRYILKDFVTGKLLYCVAPPDVPQDEFHKFPERTRKLSNLDRLPPRTVRAIKGSKVSAEDLDKAFFQRATPGVHVRGRFQNMEQNMTRDSESIVKSMQNLTYEEKPWKKINKHGNKKKREKSRRLYAHLDMH